MIREAFRLNEEKLKIGYSIVFLIKKRKQDEIFNIGFYDIEEDIIEILKKIGQDE